MLTIQERWERVRDRFREITDFRQVEILPIQRLIDDSFWTGLTALKIPAAYVVLKTDEEDGNAVENKSTWAVLIVAPTKPTRPTEDVNHLIQACREKLNHQWPDTFFHLEPKNRATFLQAMPQVATVELEINTTEYES
ncbi:MAG TPA: hypothetical protein PKC67_02560 [Kiritimatiellia bacterium]|nr:hypothetical protein [Kiritimatiellia bacterium]HMP33208.1 hypothetical protein [Kiritimatiellia bacterium]